MRVVRRVCSAPFHLVGLMFATVGQLLLLIGDEVAGADIVNDDLQDAVAELRLTPRH